MKCHGEIYLAIASRREGHADGTQGHLVLSESHIALTFWDEICGSNMTGGVCATLSRQWEHHKEWKCRMNQQSVAPLSIKNRWLA